MLQWQQMMLTVKVKHSTRYCLYRMQCNRVLHSFILQTASNNIEKNKVVKLIFMKKYFMLNLIRHNGHISVRNLQ